MFQRNAGAFGFPCWFHFMCLNADVLGNFGVGVEPGLVASPVANKRPQ